MSDEQQDGTEPVRISKAARAQLLEIQREFHERTGGTISVRQIIDQAVAEWKAARA